MTHRKTPREMLAEGEAMDEATPMGSLWTHMNTGTVYEVIGHCFIEADASPAVLYARYGTEGPEPIWARPAAEFLDGRFRRRPTA